MAKTKERTLGQVLRDRRRQLDLTQHEVARRIKTSTPYVGHLEAGKRHPSDMVLRRLAEILGLDRRDLFFLANPRVVELLGSDEKDSGDSAWNRFNQNEQLRRTHKVTAEEIALLSKVAQMGEVRSPRDFIFILKAIRYALGV
jgi:transcriptional regulator with XRE-family HTH domain